MKMVTVTDFEGGKHEVTGDSLSFRPSVYAIIINDGKVLLSPQHHGYDLPGGGQETWESVEEACIREAKEETGFDIKVKKLIGFEQSYFRMPKRWGSGKDLSCTVFYFLCEIIGGELSTEGFDVHEKEYARMAEWVDVDSLQDIVGISTVDFKKYVKKAYAEMKKKGQEIPEYSDQAKSIILQGAYKHYRKGTIYTVLSLARHTETLEEMVVYTDGEKTWCRPVELFLSPAQDGGKEVVRFQLQG